MKLISRKLLSAFLCVLTISTISHAGDDAVIWSRSNSDKEFIYQNVSNSEALYHLDSYLIHNANELEVQCTVVTVNMSNRSNVHYRHFPHDKIETYSIYYTDASVTCEKRNYADSAAMSLAKFCIVSPNEKCFDPEVTKRISKIKPTKYRR